MSRDDAPDCTRCGHARHHHPGAGACTTRVAAEAGLAVGRCGCAGYTTEAAAFAGPGELVDITTLRLRRPGEQLPWRRTA